MLPFAGQPARPGSTHTTMVVTSNEPPEGGFNAFADDGSALPVWLEDAGYRTGYVGKYLNGVRLGSARQRPRLTSHPGGPTGRHSPTTPSTRCTATTSTRTARSSPSETSRPTTRPMCSRTKADDFLRASVDSGDPFFLKKAMRAARRGRARRPGRAAQSPPGAAPRGPLRRRRAPTRPVVQRAGTSRTSRASCATTLS